MLPPKQNLPADQRKLLRFYARLGEGDRESLLAFAEFLAGRAGDACEAVHPLEPVSLPRPPVETVIAAIKRLSKSYHMLDRSSMLTETSTLMTAHVMHGRPAPEVIDELEILFTRYYEQYKATSP